LEERVGHGFREGARLFAELSTSWPAEVARVARLAAESLRSGGKVLAFGNGGSAADAQHLAAELVNRFRIDRPPLAGLALTTDTSTLTAIGNDFGFDEIFEKQVNALARRGDVAVGITTSGGSSNVLRGLAAARARGCTCVGLTGRESGKLSSTCHAVFAVPSRETPRIQECHVAWIHAFCDLLDELLFPEATA
jgi:D-sedoheptulose 7-phosphate isomerase